MLTTLFFLQNMETYVEYKFLPKCPKPLHIWQHTEAPQGHMRRINTEIFIHIY